MNASRHPARWLATLCALLAFSGLAHAQTRTWVSGVGDDVNPCSRTAPCKTFAGAISKTAAGGTISVLDPGGYGGVTITKAITIDGNGFMGSITTPGSSAITVNAGVNDVVTLRELSIYGGGTGINAIRYIGGQALHVDHVVISGYKSAGASSGNAIIVNPATAVVLRLYVNDALIHNNGATATGGGILVAPTGGATAFATIQNSRINNNVGYGVKAMDSTTLVVEDSVLSGNKKSGVAADSSAAFIEATVRGCVLNENGWDTSTVEASVLSRGINSVVHVSGNVISNNEYGVRRVSSGFMYSTGDNKMISNTFPGTVTGATTQL